MLVRTFKSRAPFNILLLLLITYLLKLPYLLLDDPIPIYIYQEPLSDALFNNFLKFWDYKTLNVLITGLVYFIQALWLNKIVNDYSLLFKSTYLPALLYIILTSSFPTFFALDAAILIIFLQLLLLTKLFNLYKAHNAIRVTFDCGVIIAISSLFYFPAILWLMLIWFALIILRPFSWREWIAAPLGFMVPYIFVAFYYFWNDNMEVFVAIWRPLKNSFWQININPTPIDFLPLLPVALTLIVGISRLRENFYKNVLLVRKSQQVLIACILISLVSYYLKPSFRLNHFILLAAPLAVFVSYYFLVAKKKWLSEGLVLLMVLSILYFQIY